MFGALSQAARLGIGAVAAVAVAAGAWLYSRPPGPPPTPAPLAAVAPPAAPEPAPAPAAAPEKPAERFAPTLDVVRVDTAGSATVAGQAEASARVSLRVDDAEIAFANADGAGAYASLFTLPPSDAPRTLTVVATGADGVDVAGKDRVILAPIKAAEKPLETVAAAPEAAPKPAADPAAPAALKQTETGVAVITAADIANVTIDSVTYDGDAIKIGGRGAGGAIVRMYLNNVDSASAPIGADGAFGADLLGVAAGTYTLRADQLDSAGKVTSRYEIDITKAAPQELAKAAPAPAVVQVAAGTTLWAIAKAKFGDGLMYVQVYEANKDKIRDPNLIYPGQVLSMPAAP